MARRVAVVVLVTMAVLGLYRVVPFLTEQRGIVASTATPDPIAAAEPLGVGAASSACFNEVTFVPSGSLVHFTTGKGPSPGPQLTFTFDAPGFKASAKAPPGWKPGPLTFPVPTPQSNTIGKFCIRNDGDKTITLIGSTEGRLVSRPTTTVDDQPSTIKVALRFDEPKQRALPTHVGAILSRASALEPMPTWFLWVLFILILVGLPAGVIWAFAGSVEAPAAPAPVAAPAPPLPLPRVRRGIANSFGWGVAKVRAIPLPWLIVGFGAAAIAYFAYYALQIHGYQNDEYEYVYLARWTQEHFPQSLWDFTTMTRGLQRLEIWLLSVPLSLFRSPTAFEVAHFLNVLAFTSAAIPAYLMARGLGVTRGWRLIAAVLTVALPWAVVVVTVLTEPLAYPAFVWCTWAIWRSAVVGGWKADVTALVLIAVAMLARTNLALLAPLLVVTVLAQELCVGSWRRGLARRHAVLIAAVALAGVYLLLGSAGAVKTPRSLAGNYGLPVFGISHAFLEKTWFYLARVVAGVGFFVFVIGLPWLGQRLVSPRRDAAAFALSVVSVLGMLAVLYVNSPAGTDERYIIYLAPALILGFVGALARRDLWWPLVLPAGAVAIWFIHHVGWNGEGGAYGYFIGPAESFYARIVLGNLQQALGTNPNTIAFLGQIIATGLAAWVVSRRFGAARALPWLVGFVLVLQLAQMHYAVSHFTRQAMNDQPGLSGRAWIDEAIYGKGNAANYLEGQGNTTVYNPVWMEAGYWNNSLRGVVAPAPVQVQVPRDDVTHDVKIDNRTGLISPQAGLPDYAVVPADGRAGIVGKTIAKAGYIPAELVQVDRPWRVAWEIGGLEVDGYAKAGQDVGVRVFSGGVPKGSTNACLQVDALSPFGFVGELRARTGQLERSAHLEGDGVGRLQIPLERLRAGAPLQDLTLGTTGKPVKLPDGREATMQLGGLAIVDC